MIKPKKILRLILYTILIGGTILGVILGFIYAQYGQKIEESHDCGVIFGAAVWRDDKPSQALYDRTMAGINLARSQKINCLVLSGGPSTYGAHEVTVMKKIILESNISNITLVEDYVGMNTLATISKLNPSTRYVFISNDFHLARIRLLAWREGLKNNSVHSAPYNNGRYRKEAFFVAREVAGILYYGFRLDTIDF